MRVSIPDEFAENPKAYVNTHHARELTDAALALYRAAYTNSSLSLREFEGARIRMAQINGCALCRNWRSGGEEAADMIARSDLAGRETVADRGPAPDEQYYESVADWRVSPLYTERERLAIGYAEYMSLDPQGLAADDDFWARVHTVFTDPEIVELSYCVFSWFQGRITHALGLDGVCDISATLAGGH